MFTRLTSNAASLHLLFACPLQIIERNLWSLYPPDEEDEEELLVRQQAQVGVWVGAGWEGLGGGGGSFPSGTGWGVKPSVGLAAAKVPQSLASVHVLLQCRTNAHRAQP